MDSTERLFASKTARAIIVNNPGQKHSTSGIYFLAKYILWLEEEGLRLKRREQWALRAFISATFIFTLALGMLFFYS